MPYILPVTGSGSNQSVTVADHEAAVNAAIDEKTALEADARAMALAAEAEARALADAAEAEARAVADEAIYRASLGNYRGRVADLSSAPTVVSLDNRSLTVPGGDQLAEATYRAALGRYVGRVVDLAKAPSVVSLDNRSLAVPGSDLVAATITPAAAIPYLSAGVLRAAGGVSADRVVNADPGVTWLAAEGDTGRIRAVRQIGGVRDVVTVGDPSGTPFVDGATAIWLDVGQSNGRGSQSGGVGVEVLRIDYPFPDRLLMLGPNVWGGFGSNSTDVLDPNTLTGFAPLVGSSFGSNGTTAVESAALAYASLAAAECGGWVPRLVVGNVAVGGQTIAQIGPTPPGAETAWDNLTAYLERMAVLHDRPERLLLPWLFMRQGESNTTTATLGADHDAYRAAVQALAVDFFAQSEPVRMISWQPASYSTSTGARSILTHYLAERESRGVFWCGGPSYQFPFVDQYLHHAALGHDMCGEMNAAIVLEIERTGFFDPLHMVSAAITGANEITVTLSEAAQIDTGNAFVAAVENAGIVVPGRTVTGVTVSGAFLVITTSDAAAGATAVRAAMTGQTDPRTAEAIPRTNIRAANAMGVYRSGMPMHKWLCVQEISIS